LNEHSAFSAPAGWKCAILTRPFVWASSPAMISGSVMRSASVGACG